MGDNSPFYGNSGGGGGGGFMTTSPYGSQASPSSAQRKAASVSLRPVTIKQILEATQAHSDAEFTIDGTETSQVTFVGVVRNVVRQATNVQYLLEDGTGEIEARIWIDSTQGDSKKGEDIEDNTYVRVLGILKSFSGRRHVAATRVRPVKAPMEVYFHLIEALHVHLQLTRGPARPSAGGSASMSTSAGGASRSDYTMGAGAGGGGGAAPSTHDKYAHLPELQRDIITFIETAHKGEEGCHISAISRGVAKGRYTASDISEALEKLTDDGHVYSTTDENHFTTVDSV